MHAQTRTHASKFTHARAHTQTHTHTHASHQHQTNAIFLPSSFVTHTHTHTHTHIYIYIYIYTRIHPRTHAHTLILWFRTSLIYINNFPTRCNTMQSIYYSASSLYMFRVSTTPIIRSTQNCNYSLRYWSCFCAAIFLQRGQMAILEGGSCTKNMNITGGCSYSFVYS